jgi:hypothetical protein
MDDSIELRSSLASLLRGTGYQVMRETAGVLDFAQYENGSAKCYDKGRVGVASFSGGCLAAIQSAGVMLEFLRALSSVPVRVTRIDAAVDVPEPSEPHLSAVYSRGVAGVVSLTRKAVLPTSVRSTMGPALYGLGADTGTVYLGQRGKNDVVVRVYDKRQEVMSRTGVDLGHSLTRYEVESHLPGASLRDAWDPTALFWHFMAGVSPDLLPAPADVPPWVAGDMSLDLPPVVVLDPATRLRNFIEVHSGTFRQLLALGDATCAPGSPHGRSYALRLVAGLAPLSATTGEAEPEASIPSRV